MAYESKFKREDIDELFRAILLLENERNATDFLKTYAQLTRYTP